MAVLALALAGCVGLGGGAPVPAGSRMEVVLLETTDLHQNIVGFDYYRFAEDKSVGLERTATLIRQERAKSPNTLLFDNGDTIQGTVLGDFQATVKPVACDTQLGIYKAMSGLGYDAASIGNHEFNYGLAYLSRVTGSRFNVEGLPDPAQQKTCRGPDFPLVLANVYSLRDRQPLFKPYVILERTFKGTRPDGSPFEAPLRVGVIGFTPPWIMTWDKRWLEGRVYTEGLVETATRFIPAMRQDGADVVVAISHSGLDNSPYAPTMEHGNWHLSRVPGIDALLMGHSHQPFPDPASRLRQFNLPGVDKAKGTVNGVPAVMASYWGKHLGIIRMSLAWDGTRWTVDRAKTTAEVRSVRNADGSYVEYDPSVRAAVAVEHQGTMEYVKTPIGTSDFRMTTFFADVGDVTAVQIVNQAQAGYAARLVREMPQYAHLPVLSMSAPFKGGFGGATDYTDVPSGPLAINNAADLYLYPNTLHVVKVNGADMRNWLEASARRFNRIDPAKAAPQELVAGTPSYHFDMITSPDVAYEIDVTQPPGSRIRNLTYKGAAVSPTQEFVIATNNYRASGGGNFPGLDGSKTILQAPDTNREALIEFIRSTKALTRAANGSARSWRFTKVSTAGPVVFHAPPGQVALARAAGITNVTQAAPDDGGGKGLALYHVDLSR